MMTDEAQLLSRYVRERSESAFAELVQRSAGLVYSAALRQVGGDTGMAQDVSQAVIIDLARKAPQLVDHPVLASWLYTSTRFAALKALRAQQRRKFREQEAQFMQDIDRASAHDADWEKVRPIIDEALCDLSECDRTAVLMRYFEGQPFAAMGQRLGIGETSARMRSDRALDKLREKLARRGITSTAAALGLVLATNAVAAPPAGLASTFAAGALAKSAAVGSGAGLLMKFYNLLTFNKVQSGAVGVLAVTATGFASYESDEKARNILFFAYTICFGVGLLFSILSAIGAHIFGGHSELGHDAHVGSSHGDGQGHAEGGGGAHDMPGFAPLSPTTIATFVTAFGGFGMILSQIDLTRSPWISAPLATMGGLGIAVAVFFLFRLIFMKTQASSEGRVAALVGHSATVITPIAPGAVGEIAYVQSGTRYSAPARSEHGLPVANGATVRIVRIVGSQFYVSN